MELIVTRENGKIEKKKIKSDKISRTELHEIIDDLYGFEDIDWYISINGEKQKKKELYFDDMSDDFDYYDIDDRDEDEVKILEETP